MKKLFTFLIAVLLTATIWAQTPQKMSYNAVIRNANNNLVTNTTVAMQISILQGSASGSAVYVETQTPTTNANGMVSIEIGGGTVVSGNFSIINWANGTFFMKIETDPDGATGGISYTITGTSQLLSVPYALHAKTADNGITPAQTTKLAGIADGAEVNVNADWNALSGDAQILNKPTIPTAADGSETKLSAGTNVTITGSGTTVSPYVINASASSGGSNHYVGELYGGGVVFWVDHTGQHGLIASMIDLSTALAWSNLTVNLIGATAQSDWDGNANTIAITGQAGHTSSAAKLCADYTNANYGTGTYSDWYLPSRGELNDLWNNLKAVQKTLDSDGNGSTTAIVKGYYWSSSEYTDYYAWGFNFVYGVMNDYNKVMTYPVRAVRAF